MLKGGGKEDNLLYKIKDMNIDINNPVSNELYQLETDLTTLGTYEPKMLSISLIREIVDKFKLDVNVPSKNLTVSEDERGNLVTNFIIKMNEYIQTKKENLQGLGSDGGGDGVSVDPDAPPPVPVEPALTEGVGRKEDVERGGEDALIVNLDAPKQSRLSDVNLSEIGFTKSDNGTFTPTGDRTPELGKNQKTFIISKSKEIKDALADVAIKERVNSNAIGEYNKAIEEAATKGYLGEGFVHAPITGGKRTRRRRSKTRNRRTKNNRKKLYKR